MYKARLLPDLLEKLQTLFEIFFYYKISIKPNKSFLNYPNIAFLGYRVNSLYPTTSEKKLKAIKLLISPNILGALEYYLSLSGYLQGYIHFYTQLTAPLQVLKTSFLHWALLGDQQRSTYISKTKLGTFTAQKLALFFSIQETLSQPSTLVHHNQEKMLWINLDTSKEFGFGAIVFHTALNKIVPEGW